MVRILEIFGSGMIAAYAMFLTNWIAFRLGWVQVSIVEVFNDFLGHIKPHQSGFRFPVRIPTGIVRFLVGGFFALVYAAFVQALPTHTVWAVMTVCIVMGFVHGFAVATADAIVVSDGHPVAVYRQFGHQIIATHLTSHLVYGIVLGLMFTMMA